MTRSSVADISPANDLPPNPGPWTDEQWRAICTTGRSLLVSAAAGSGKTAVLAERCAYLVCDAPPSARCGVDELLVVTFTNVAAAEMRERIERALRKRLESAGARATQAIPSAREPAREPVAADDDHELSLPDARLAHQLALIERAQISTLHGFCSQVLRQHFHLIGIDPNFTLLDQEEAVLLRNDTARALFDHHYTTDDPGEFQHLIDRYGDGDDQRLIHRVIHTHNLLNSLTDPDAWLAAARQRVDDGATDLGKSAVGKELVTLLRDQIRGFRDRCVRTAQQLEALGDYGGYVDVLGEYIAAADEWATLKGPTLLSNAVQSFTPPDLPRMPGTLPNKELAKKLIDGIRDEVKPKGALFELLRFTGGEWQDSLKRTQGPTDVFLRLVDEFSKRYRIAKDNLRSMDFNDLERFTLQILSDASSSTVDALAPSQAAREYHARFRYVLVDEYQDINPIQDAILSLVSRESLRGHGAEQPVEQNLFCVGDVKQSIYRFRLADPARFMERHARFKSNGHVRGGEAIDLQANFRSRGKLLDAINGVFARLMTADAAELHYDDGHKLREGLKYPPTNGDDGDCFRGAPIELHLLPKPPRGAGAGTPAATDDEAAADPDLDRTEREAAFIAHRIRQLRGETDGCRRMTVFAKSEGGSLAPRPIEYRDVVVLLRSMKVKSDQFAEQLRAAGIPVHSESATGFFESMEIRDMLALLRLLDNQRQDVPMAAVLRSPLVALPSPDDCLARIRLAYPNKTVPFHQAVVRYARERGDELAGVLDAFLVQLQSWRETAHRRPLAELIWTVYDQTGYLAFCDGLPDGEQRVANLIALHERARQFGTFQRQGLGRFMQFLQSLQEESDLGQSSIASEADDVVRVMSIHRSKGLEFPVVFLPDLGKRHNLVDAAGSILVDRSAYVGFQAVDEEKRIRYPSLAWALAKEKITRQMLAEEMRVLYVAMTRAREHLILVGTCDVKQPDLWRDKWTGHDGALPADEVLRGRCMLDWIGPVTEAVKHTAADAFNVALHDEHEVNEWGRAYTVRPALSPAQAELAQLKPLSPPPPKDAAAATILDRLCTPYTHEFFTKQPAVQSVTSRVKSPAFEQELDLPKCVVAEKTTVSAADAGSATHLVLQHINFTADATPDAVREQVRKLESRRLILPAHTGAVDVDAVVWLMKSELGRLLREHANVLRREMPVHFAAPADGAPRSDDPQDRVMIRGKLDVLIPTPNGLVVADYKTDRVTESALAARVELYRPQLASYAGAVARITGEPIASVYLAFVAARTLVKL